MGNTTENSTRFRKLFPILQIGTTILLFGFYYMNWRVVTPFVLRTPEGQRTVWIHDFLDSFSRQLDWVQAMNFPAGWIVIPAELAFTNGEGLDVGYPSYGHMRFLEYGFVGMFFWFLTGRWIDSGIAMFQQREATLPMFADWVFSICVTVSGLVEIGLEYAHGVYLGWGVVWVLVGGSAVLLHIHQGRSVRRARLELDSSKLT